MAPKRDQSLSVKVSDYEALVLRRVAAEADMELSDLLRICITLALHLPCGQRKECFGASRCPRCPETATPNKKQDAAWEWGDWEDDLYL